MKQRFLLWLAAASLLVSGAAAATRPRYGGTLRMESRESLRSLDPADLATTSLGRNVARLLYETLTDENGQDNPALVATSTESTTGSSADPGVVRTFTLRADAHFSDGTPLTADVVAASLHLEGCAATAQANQVVVRCQGRLPSTAEFSGVSNSIMLRAPDGSLLGCGPFLAGAPPGTMILLRANDNYAGGRPFLDQIQIVTGRSLRDQQLDFDLGKADVIELAPDQARRASQAGVKIAVSAPVELLALAFQNRAAAVDDRVRQALSAAIDRDAIYSILLQRQGEPAGGLLPQWISGYAFLFPTAADPPRARQLALEAGGLKLTLSYDAGDPLAKLVSDRVALNARDAGILLQSYGETPGRPSNADLRLVRLRVASSDPAAALEQLAARLDPAQAAVISMAAPEKLYAGERALLESARVVPLVYVPESYALAPRVHDWTEPRIGGWPAAAAWVDKP